jgi:hypothetical protein
MLRKKNLWHSIAYSLSAFSVRQRPLSIETVFTRILTNCEGTNALNRVIIAIERRSTPQEVRVLVRILRNVTKKSKQTASYQWRRATQPGPQHRQKRSHKLAAAAQEWITKLEVPKPTQSGSWRREFITQGMGLYRNGTPHKDRPLLIGFSGNAQRLMMPLHTFLNSVQCLGVDVLILWAKEKSKYELGIPSLGEDLASSLSALEQFTQSSEYQKIGVMGVSGGGVPAAIFSLGYINAPYLVVGTQSPETSSHAKQWGEIMAPTEQRPCGTALVGDHAPQRDLDAANYLENLLGVKKLVKPGKHSPLHDLALRGELALLIENALFQSE